MNTPVRLGQEVFVLYKGDVSRTMVSRVEKESYDFLNGRCSRSPHWFSFDEAIAALRGNLETRKVALRKTIDQLSAKGRAIQTDRYQQSVTGASYKIVMQVFDQHRFTHRSRTRQQKTVLAPRMYLPPGQRVFVVITARIDPRDHVYRPYTHFVLETEVRSAYFDLEGAVHYDFKTPFRPEEHFVTRNEAMERMRSHPEWRHQKIEFVSMQEEVAALKKMDEENLPF